MSGMTAMGTDLTREHPAQGAAAEDVDVEVGTSWPALVPWLAQMR